MRIIIGGDVVPTDSNAALFQTGDFLNNVDERFRNIWGKADFRVFNLECPLGNFDSKQSISKSGISLLCPENCIKGLVSLSPSVVCLANNHILDYGQKGLENTIRLFKNNGLDFTGIIEKYTAELKVKILEKDGVKVGFYNLCETEFNVASDKEAGANPYKEFSTFREVSNAKKKCDYLVVIYHGGKEFYRYPSPRLKKLCETLIDSGADFVTCQHSHCIGSYEVYKGKHILYGQGNFIFDGPKDEFWRNGLLVELLITSEDLKVNYIPIKSGANGIPQLEPNENILKSFVERSHKIKDEDFIKKEYEAFSRKKIDEYIENFEPHNFWDKVYHKIFKQWPKKKYGQNNYLWLLNAIRCEAHRELFIRGLEEKVQKHSKE